jgi:hypothetical protein
MESEIFMKLVRLIKMYLSESYSKVRIGKYLSDTFPIQNSLEERDALLSFPFQLCFRIRL